MTTREDEIRANEPIDWKAQFYAEAQVTDRLRQKNQRLREDESQLRIQILKLNQQIGELKFHMGNKDSALRSVESIISNSQGVAGWHMNGEIATWGELGLDEEIAEALEPNEKTTR